MMKLIEACASENAIVYAAYRDHSNHIITLTPESFITLVNIVMKREHNGCDVRDILVEITNTRCIKEFDLPSEINEYLKQHKLLKKFKTIRANEIIKHATFTAEKDKREKSKILRLRIKYIDDHKEFPQNYHAEWNELFRESVKFGKTSFIEKLFDKKQFNGYSRNINIHKKYIEFLEGCINSETDASISTLVDAEIIKYKETINSIYRLSIHDEYKKYVNMNCSRIEVKNRWNSLMSRAINYDSKSVVSKLISTDRILPDFPDEKVLDLLKNYDNKYSDKLLKIYSDKLYHEVYDKFRFWFINKLSIRKWEYLVDLGIYFNDIHTVHHLINGPLKPKNPSDRYLRKIDKFMEKNIADNKTSPVYDSDDIDVIMKL